MTIKIEQIAIGSKNSEQVVKNLSEVLGLSDWSKDTVTVDGLVNEKKCFGTVADLNFNYELGPFEFEILQYKEGDNWHNNLYENNIAEFQNFLSHLGLHIDDPKEFLSVKRRLSLFFPIVQDVVTKSHTNEAIKDSRRYRYIIFDSRDEIGFDLKIIQRLDLNGNPYIEPRSEKIRKLNLELSKIQNEIMSLSSGAK